MNFTSEPPKTPGFYAWKQHDAGNIELRKFDEHDLMLLPENSHRLWGEWCRLVPAEEVERAWDEGLITDKLEKLTYAQLTRDELYLKSRAKLIAEGKE